MTYRYTLKSVLLSLGTMGMVSLGMLVILAAITYHFKWQAPQAQVGITLTYIISGLAGGLTSTILNSREEKKGSSILSQGSLRQKFITGFTLGTVYTAILLGLSIAVSQNTNWDIGQILLIWILLSCSSVLGVFLGTALGRNG